MQFAAACYRRPGDHRTSRCSMAVHVDFDVYAIPRPSIPRASLLSQIPLCEFVHILTFPCPFGAAQALAFLSRV